MTVRQSDIVNRPAEQAVRKFMTEHAGEWVATAEVHKGTGSAKRVVEDLLLIMALGDEIACRTRTSRTRTSQRRSRGR
jgi:hypothetical protein